MPANQINGYLLEKNLNTNNAGNCKWGFAEKKGKRYFVKEFLDPVFPTATNGLNEKIVERKKRICREYEQKQRRLYQSINGCSGTGLQRIEEFFRSGSHYYVIMQAIEELDHSIIKDDRFTEKERIRVCRVLVHSLAALHKAGFIHGDIKLDNILLYQLPSENLSVKIIDFDDAFRKEESPEPGDEVHGDQVYLAPETFRLMLGEDIKLTPAIDTFALGILLYQILMKLEMPEFDKTNSNYAFEAVLEGQQLRLKTEELPEPFRSLIPQMLAADPEERISLPEVDNILRQAVLSEAVPVAGQKAGAPGEKDRSAEIMKRRGLIFGKGFEKIFDYEQELEAEIEREHRAAWEGPVKEEDFFSAAGDL